MSHITVAEIRAAYPNPMSAGKLPAKDTTLFYDRTRYCLGGALCFALIDRGIDAPLINFPSLRELKSALQLANPSLTADTADYRARAIMDYNDHEHFEDAYQELTRALVLQESEHGQ